MEMFDIMMAEIVLGVGYMETYSSFAMVYDELMDNIPYDDWYVYLKKLLERYHVLPSADIAELGCGTGNMTRRLAGDGYILRAIDLSEDMLMIAKDKQMQEYYKSNEESVLKRIQYIHQNMCQLELDREMDAIVSICDSMNYLLYEEEFLATLKGVKKYLKEDGVFIFDMKTPYFFKNVCGNQVFTEDREDVTLIWDNCYDETNKVNEYALTLFVKQGETYQKFQEFHYQRAYEMYEVRHMIKKSGLKVAHVYEAFTQKKAHRFCERVYYIVTK